MSASARLGCLVALASLAAACAGTTEDTESTDDALVETSRVDLRLAAFIPCDGVDGFGIYDGDGRSFSWEGAAVSSRILLDASVDPEGADTVKGRVFPSEKFNRSAVASSNGWCVKLRAGARPERTATADASGITARITDLPDQQGYAITRVTLDGHAKNPLVFLAPQADGVITVDIWYAREGGKKKPRYVTYSGYHDAFPSWELYVDQVPVFQYDALRHSSGPLDLFPGNEVDHRGTCTRRARGGAGPLWACREL